MKEHLHFQIFSFLKSLYHFYLISLLYISIIIISQFIKMSRKNFLKLFKNNLKNLLTNILQNGILVS
nr:MAG TPA: hypothetical protein [Caudoviricetes sp.]